ncbi:MAG TPA: hypothetical protein VGV18_08850 [Verrucomicrobiae bacterium]|nr:hypothetical protein [Verrucomicrobiae bacterium]
MNWSFISARLSKGGLGTAAVLFGVVLAVFLHGVFVPDQILFSNDGPLGRLAAQCHHLPQRFFGCWQDLNNIGFDGGAASPSISFVMQWLLGPVWFSKFYALVSLLILGLGAWSFFRQSKLAPAACLLGGLAAMLTSIFFCVGTWGLGSHDIAAGMVFFALACLADPAARQRRLLLILAGFAVGMDVMEGADMGALFSLIVAAYAIYQSWIAEGSRVKNMALGVGKLAVVVVVAGFLAAQTVVGLVSTSISGISGTQQDAQTKAQRWGWATQWSLPKTEALGLIEPGLFGYRLESRDGGQYWGKMGRDPAWDQYLANGQKGPEPRGVFRYVGGSNYLGMLILLLALWSLAQSLRRNNSVFLPTQKKWIWFWSWIAVVSLLLSFGHYAPFYRWFYALPYVSTIRNPTKFLYLFSLGFVVLFAFGIDALWRKYLNNYQSGSEGGWKRADRFEKNWLIGCAIVWVAAVAGWYVYWLHKPELEAYLQTARLTEKPADVAAFSIWQAGWFVLFFFLAAALLTLIFRGAFSGKRATAGVLALGLLLLSDLGLANQPWVVYWNYKDKYSSNPIFDQLRDKPYEHRVALAPISWPNQLSIMYKLYKGEWIQQQFPFYNIQTFETVEMSRIPQDFSAFTKLINTTLPSQPLLHFARACQLTDTRYIIGPADFANLWNRQLPNLPLDLVTRFGLELKPGITHATNLDQIAAVPETYGNFGLFDMAASLPRAKLYSRWEINTNNTDVLSRLFSPQFNPQSTVFVAGNAPADTQTNQANPPDDAVQFVSYASRDIVLSANATVAGILLLSSHFDPDWHVFVDRRPATLLRCNFLMRGVYLPPGSHTVEFRFQPPVRMLCVSVLAVVIALIVLGRFIYVEIKSRPRVTIPVPVTPTLSLPQKRPGKTARKKAQRK